jgi:predicted secreted protein
MAPAVPFLSAILTRLHLARDDARGRRFIAVIECLLNQNARDRGAASFPAVNAAVLALCAKYGVGLLQIPCPEIRLLGLNRDRPPGMSIRACLEKPEGWQSCREISDEIVVRVRAYLDQGVELLAILGGNPESPGCAVHASATSEQTLDRRSGILMQTLALAMEAASIQVPIRGIRDCRPELLEADLRWLEQRFQATAERPAPHI